jgi:5'-nucleotidase
MGSDNREREDMKGRGSIGVLVGLCLTFALFITASVAAAKPAKPKPDVQVQLLGINDFHGQIQPSGSVGATPAGGAEFFHTHIQMLEATNPNTLVVSAGDLIGASPLISALFHDEPTIESMNLAGLDFNGVGNHEFDEGPEELIRMQEGGCHPVDGCLDGDDFAGADFQFLAANVAWASTGKTIFPAYKIRSFAGKRMAFIGMTLEGTPSIVTPAAVASLDFLDEVETVNALVPQLQAKGVQAIVVLLHEGGSTTAPINESTINSCNGANGPAVDITNALHDEVDIVITGHTNWAVNCRFGNKIMTGARNIGRLVTDIDVVLDGTTGEVDMAATTVNNRIVTRTVAPNPAQTALIAKYDALVAPLRDRVIGEITADITRTANAAGESALGDVIADAQLDATDDPGFGDAVIAFMNAGGIRNDLIFSQSSGGEAAGEVTYGEAFNVQPFGNSLVTMTLSGATIEQVLERQFKNGIGILQVSNGFTYTYDLTRAVNDRIDPATVKLNGVTLNPAASYRVTVNNFLADGGDNYVELREGTNRLGGDVDLDAFEKYLRAHSPVAPGPQNRITKAG